MVNRRSFLGAAAAASWAGAAPVGFKLGVMDGILGRPCEPASVAAAASLGLQGLQVTLGQARKGRPMPLAVNATQEEFVAASRQHKVELAATYIDVLHTHCLKNDPYAKERVLEGLQITRNLGAKILMTVFFGKCSLETHNDSDRIIEAFGELVPDAERAGVILGFENLLPASDNIRIHDQINSPWFKIYYDVGNARNMVDVDPAAELKLLGRRRLCQVHFKDRGYLGEGNVDFRSVYDALAEIGFTGYAVLETASPSRDAMADLKKNLDYLRTLG